MAAPNHKRNELEALTSIPRRIHCAATSAPEQDEDFVDELDEIEIDNFLTTLAEVAMAVATRRLTRKKDAA